jgi:3-oxoacyl-[acyl-carrier-protein] synthase-3
MNFSFQNKRITGILTVLPKNEVKFDDEMSNYNFPAAKSLKLKATMGYKAHRIVKEGTCVSDLCIYGLGHLLNEGLLRSEDIDALILVTQSPDYFMPPTSNVIQGALKLKEDMICLDINQGCAGYIVGLFQAFMLLEQEHINKVVLLNADVMSRKTSKYDRNSYPLIGDGASVTVIESYNSFDYIIGNIKMDGSRHEALMIPAGGFRNPSSIWTGQMKRDEQGNTRSLDNLVMKGDEVFNFIMKEVPEMIESLFNFRNFNISFKGVRQLSTGVDYFFFHQPNRFILNKLADKLEIPRDKMPSNIVENFGNASGVTIPTAITYNLGNQLVGDSFLMCLAGFGVGLSWGSILMRIGNLNFNKIIYY